MEMKNRLWENLPKNFNNEIVEFVPTGGGFSATVRSTCINEDDVGAWITEYSKTTFTSWIIRKTYPAVHRLRL